MDEANTADTDYLHQQQAAIEAWRARPPSVAGRVLGTVASPVAWVIRKAVPASAIEGVLRGADWVAQKTTAAGVTAGQPAPDLRDADAAAERFRKQSVALAVVEGAGTGATGLPGLVVDIPAIITLALRTIRGVGAAYGYTGADEAERQFALGVLAAAGANTPAEKQAALALLVQLNVLIARTTFKTMASVAAAQPLAFCNGDVTSFGLAVSEVERAELCTLLDGLRQLGKIAAWRTHPPAEACSFGQVIDTLAERFGRVVVGAVLAAPEMRPEPQPAWLMPIGAFDHAVGPAPAANARLFGLDLAAVALPSASEERGISLPGRDGLWLVHVLPLGASG